GDQHADDDLAPGQMHARGFLRIASASDCPPIVVPARRRPSRGSRQGCDAGRLTSVFPGHLQRSAIRHFSHRGRRARQTYRPCRLSQWWAWTLDFAGTTRSSLSATSSGVLPVAMPVRLPTRKMWVSTAMVASPNATLSTTFAVLRPTPGSASNASRVRGTSPPCSSAIFLDNAMRFFALVRKRPMVLINPCTRSSPSVAIFSGVSAAANSAGVALLTPASVACAESTTATSNVNGLMCLSSPLGSGLAAWKRRNASSISAGCHCGAGRGGGPWGGGGGKVVGGRTLGRSFDFCRRARARPARALRGSPGRLAGGSAGHPARCLASHSFGIVSSMAPDNDPAQELAQEPAIFSAVLTPHRSLSRKGFLALMLVAGGASLALGTTFLLAGAWPVFGFCGLDVLLLYWAFKVSSRRARAYEQVTVTPSELTVRQVSHRGRISEWTLNPLWVRLDRVVHAEFGIERLFLVSHGRRVAIAGCLGPQEKESFALALSAALGEAKRGPTRTVFD